MAVKVIIGAQWGDEGKGKLVDSLSSQVDIVARYQGGANAGHTVHIGDNKYILHLIPGGILRPGIICVIGNGVVFDPAAFFEEIDFLAKNEISADGRLFISNRAHVVFPYHKKFDQVKEDNLQAKKIGTTGRGIGPAYVDKFNRCGIRITDLYDNESLKEKLKENIENINHILIKEYHQNPFIFEEEYDKIRRYAEKLEPFVKDTILVLNQAWHEGKNILLEGAQGSLLDIDFGSYPYVTSSNPTTGGAITGTGLPPQAINEVIGVVKAYTTRVGSGPFPSEDTSAIGERLRAAGHEFGATTGRPRRCGWFDAVAMNYATRINGFTKLALTKLDVLDEFDEIKVCVNYRYKGKPITHFPSSLQILQQCEPVYETFQGWHAAVEDCRYFKELPEEAQKYVSMLEKICSVPIKYISVGVEREQMIVN
jgi:adenylosuccinate synthase